MNMFYRLRDFFLSIVPSWFQFLTNSDTQQPPSPPQPPSSAAANDPETAATEQNPQSVSPVGAGHQNEDWAKIILAFCLASAVETATLSVQINSKLPLTFHLFSFAISLAFSSLFIAKFIPVKYRPAALVLNQMGVFFAATAFFSAVTIPFPMSLKCTTWALYAVSLLAVILCNHN